MRIKKHYFFNMYFTTTLSLSLVLFFVGMLTLTLYTATNITSQVKESISLSVLLADKVESSEVERITHLLSLSPIAKSVQHISKEEALQEHIQSLGDNPTEFLGYNPLLASLEVKLNSTHVHNDSIAKLELLLKPFDSVERIIYPKQTIDLVNQNVTKLTFGMLIVTTLLLLISLMLIHNTIRLGVYSKRFLINTMKLVGAESKTIRAPFVQRHILLGVLAALLASLFLVGTLYYLQYNVGVILVTSTKEMVMLPAFIVAVGIVITGISSYISVSKYTRMKTDNLYYI